MKPANIDNYSSDDDFVPLYRSVVPEHTSNNSGACSSHGLRTCDERSHNDIGGSMVPSDFEDFDDEIDTYQDEFFNDCSNYISDSELSPFNTAVPISSSQREKKIVQRPGGVPASTKIGEPYHHIRMSRATDSNIINRQTEESPSIPKSTGVFQQVALPPVLKPCAHQQYTSASSRIRAKSTYMYGSVSEVDGTTDRLEAHLSSKKRLIDEIYKDSCSTASSQTAKRTRVLGHEQATPLKPDGWTEKTVQHRSNLSKTMPQKLPTVSTKISSTPIVHIISNSQLNTASTNAIFRPPSSVTSDPCSFFTAGHNRYDITTLH